MSNTGKPARLTHRAGLAAIILGTGLVLLRAMLAASGGDFEAMAGVGVVLAVTGGVMAIVAPTCA